MESSRQHIVFCRLGHIEYEEAWKLQQQLQNVLIKNKRSDHPKQLENVCLLVEHPPVFTLGKSGDETNLLADQETLDKEGATFVRIDRGGDITYHGPGQIVGYPILDLDRFYTDIHRYLRELEEVIMLTCGEYDIPTDRFDDRTGVWVNRMSGDERKVCAMGIRCSRWVTMHGFALNLSTNLNHFDLIVPCGIQDRGFTSMEMEALRPIERKEVEDHIMRHFGEIFDAEVRMLERKDAKAFLEAYLER